MAEYTYKPSEVQKHIIDLVEAGLVPFLTSGPGLGKSAIMALVAKYFNLYFIDFRLSQATPEDLLGLPMRSADGTRAQFVPFDVFPDEDTPIPEGYDGFFIFFDEYNSAPRGVLAASYKILYDKEVGMKKLHPNTVICLAGNREEDNAIVNDIGTALQSRVVHIEMRADLDDFTKYGFKNGIDSRILGFLRNNTDHLHDFNPEHTNKTFACPRTWEFASNYIKDKDWDQINVGILSGIIGPAAAVKFYAFLKHFDEIPTLGTILADPQKAPVPTSSGAQFAVISMLVAHFDEKNFSDITAYIDRIPAEMRIPFFRNCLLRDRKIMKHAEFKKRQSQFADLFYDDDDETFDHAA